MNFHLHLQRERQMLRLHKDGYICARLASLLVLALAGYFASLSLRAVSKLLLGPHLLALGHGLQAEQVLIGQAHLVLSLLSFCIAWLALGLWRLDVRAWWIALALGAPALLGGPGAAYAHLVLLFTLLLLSCQRTFKCHRP